MALAHDTGARFSLNRTKRVKLRELVDAIEAENEEIAGAQSRRGEILAEAKAMGFNTRALKRLIAWRRIEDGDRVEIEEAFDLYVDALSRGN